MLALANNSIKVPGVKALAAALPSLQQLQVRACLIFTKAPAVLSVSDALCVIGSAMTPTLCLHRITHVEWSCSPVALGGRPGGLVVYSS